MNYALLFFALAATGAPPADPQAVQAPKEQPQQVLVQFGQALSGRIVTICLDGTKVEKTFAGKLGFRDATHSWTSVCADVRSPITSGQFFTVLARHTEGLGGNVEMAGNIVAKYFKLAQTPDECAGLQIAVWKALEDGPDATDFTSGHFAVTAPENVMTYARQMYAAASIPGNAFYLQAGGFGGGQGSGGQGAGGQAGGQQGGSGGQGGGGGQGQLSGL